MFLCSEFGMKAKTSQGMWLAVILCASAAILTASGQATNKSRSTTTTTTTALAVSLNAGEGRRGSATTPHLGGRGQTPTTSTAAAELPTAVCWNRRGYRSLTKCLKDCGKPFTQPSSAVATKKPPMTHKVIHLNRTDYRVDKGHLHWNTVVPSSRRKFAEDEYHIGQNGTAYVCHPLSAEFMKCDKWVLEPHEYRIFQNGSLFSFIHKKMYNFGDYFIHKEDKAVTCLSPEHAMPNKERDAVLLVPWIISAISLTLALILAFVVPKLNLKHNIVLLCHMASLLAAYIAMIIRWIMEKHFQNVSCTAITLIQQYAFLTAFFWISVQSFDLWRRFVHPPANQGLRAIDKKKVLIYCLYAFGSPFLFVLITLILDVSKTERFKPFEDGMCWFKNDMVALVFFYGPIAIILIANVFFFALTIFQLHRMGKNANNINKQLNRQLLYLYAKLVIVMGLCWIMEVISWGVGGNSNAWAFTDIINSLQGLFIFLVYVIKASFIRQCLRVTRLEPVCDRYCACCCRAQKKVELDNTSATHISTANNSTEVIKMQTNSTVL